MHNLKPNTDYAIVTMQIAVKKEDFESGRYADDINALMDIGMYDNNNGTKDGVIGDWCFLTQGKANWIHRTDATVTEWETFCTPSKRVEQTAPQHSVWICWVSMEKTPPQRYDFDTLEQLNAFMEGVDQASGYLDFEQFDTEAEASAAYASQENQEEEGVDDELSSDS